MSATQNRGRGSRTFNPDDELAFDDAAESNVGGGTVGEANAAGGVPEVIDLSGVNEDEDFPILPAGIYPAVINNVQFRKSRETDRPMWGWEFDVTDESGDRPQRRKVWFYFMLDDADRRPQLKRFLKRVAPDIDLRAVNVYTTPDELGGRPCQIKVTVDTDRRNGGQRNNVRDILPPATESDDDGGELSFLTS